MPKRSIVTHFRAEKKMVQASMYVPASCEVASVGRDATQTWVFQDQTAWNAGSKATVPSLLPPLCVVDSLGKETGIDAHS